MRRLLIKRKNARRKRALRRELLHAAGCCVDGCANREYVLAGDEELQEACIRHGVRIPRSVCRAWAEAALKGLGVTC